MLVQVLQQNHGGELGVPESVELEMVARAELSHAYIHTNIVVNHFDIIMNQTQYTLSDKHKRIKTTMHLQEEWACDENTARECVCTDALRPHGIAPIVQ